MTFVKVSPDILPFEGKKLVKVKGKDIVIFNMEGKYFAIEDKCTHMGCSLSEGTVKGKSIECPCHGSAFDIKSGKVVKGPAKKDEKTFEVKTEGGQLLVNV
jgi:nitrite reductase/ring-hydroxylating ferredoxin subunit